MLLVALLQLSSLNNCFHLTQSSILPVKVSFLKTKCVISKVRCSREKVLTHFSIEEVWKRCYRNQNWISWAERKKIIKFSSRWKKLRFRLKRRKILKNISAQSIKRAKSKSDKNKFYEKQKENVLKKWKQKFLFR